MDGYAAEVERMMRRLFGSFKENDRRRYAAIEAAKLGHGGIDCLFHKSQAALLCSGRG